MLTERSDQHIPEEVRKRQAWVAFRFEDRDGKRTKVPHNPRTGRRAASNRPETWTTFEAAQAPGYEGFGYILSAEDPFFLLDLDGCRNPESGEIEEEARRLIAPFEGKAFIEASTSGRGVHVFGRGKKPGAEWCRNGELGLEVYDWGRPVVFTGKTLAGSVSELADCQAELNRLYFEAMPEHLKKPLEEAHPAAGAPPYQSVALSDDELLRKAAASKYGDEFRALMTGDTSVTGGDHSTADYRLMKALMYWTGGDEARAVQLFDRSGLAQREKWRRRADYRHRTARRARLACTSFYQPRATEKSQPGNHRAKSEQLAAAALDLRRRWQAFDWARLVGTGERANSMRGHTARDVMKVLIDAAAQHGTVFSGGVPWVEVRLGRRKLALLAATSLRTVHKAVRHLEAEGWLEFRPPESNEKPGTYVMRASLHQVHYLHTSSADPGERGVPSEDGVGGGEDLRAPRLRWSDPGRKPRRGVVRETRMIRQGTRIPPRDPIKRLGKIRGAVVDALDLAGGELELRELADALQKPRARDLVRAKTRGSKSGRNGPLIMLLQAGIVEWACEVETRREVLRLTDNWLETLEDARRLGKEVEADELADRRHRRQSEAFRRRHQVKPDRAPAEDEMRGRRDGYAERRRRAIEEAIAALFRERPEYRTRRTGQITCAIAHYLGPDFPRGPDGYPKDTEVEALLEGEAA